MLLPRSRYLAAGTSLCSVLMFGVVATLCVAKEPVAFTSSDWPWWRGPHRDGISAPDQRPPMSWSSTENVIWKTPVPGRSHGSVTVVGDSVYLAAAEEAENIQSVIRLDRSTGKQRWKSVVHTGGFSAGGNKKSSHASASVAHDGERLFITFLNRDAVYLTALDLDGKQLWQTKISDFVNHQGFGASPAVYGPLVIATADNKGGGAIAGVDRKTGAIAWRLERPSTANYTSPIILETGGRPQLLLTGCNLVTGLDPLTGKVLWEVPGSTTECVTSTVTNGSLLITSGGYPKNHVSAFATDGSGKLVWENSTRVYVPSMIIQDDVLFAVTDAGVAMCWKASTGEELWKSRLGGTFSSSIVLVGDVLSATNEEGHTYLWRANPEKFELLGENQLGEEVFATPTVVGSRIYQRVAHVTANSRQEFIYCLGAPK